MISDQELLRQYADEGAEAAFAEVVRRHMDFVYSAARRIAAQDSPLAEDITQRVFLDLARKARPLSHYKSLAGWLHRCTRFTALATIRAEQRRRVREHEATAMQEMTTTPAVSWEQLRPLLDEAVDHLNQADREAVLLRFFHGKSHREVGEAMGLSENSANKRIERALDKLRAHFSRRGITATAAILAEAISAHSVQAAPAGLAEQVAPMALANAGSVVSGGAVLAIFSMSTKTKIISVVVILLILAAAIVVHWLSVDSSTKTNVVAGKSADNSASPAALVPPVRVAMPVAAPAPMASSPASTSAPATPGGGQFLATPQTDLKSAIALGIHFLEANDLPSVLKALDSPGIVENMKQAGLGETMEAIAEAMRARDPKTDQYLAEQLELFRSIQDLTPVLTPDGKRATYTIILPNDDRRIASFIKVNGFWYYGSGTEADWDAPP